jgi:DNA mismatch repair protein MutS
MVPGRADGSFGIEVAKLAQIPPEVVERALSILQDLSKNSSNLSPVEKNKPKSLRWQVQPSTIDSRANLLKSRVQDLNMDEMTPKMAFDLLWDLKNLLNK